MFAANFETIYDAECVDMNDSVKIVTALAKNTEQAERFVKEVVAASSLLDVASQPPIEGKRIVGIHGISSNKDDDAMQYEFGLLNR